MKDFPEEKDASAEGAIDDALEPLLRVTNTCESLLKLESFSFHFMLGLTVWGVEPVVTHQTPWLESTGVCGGKPSWVLFEKESMAQLKARDFETGQWCHIGEHQHLNILTPHVHPSAADEPNMVDAEGAWELHSMVTKLTLEHIIACLHRLLVKTCYTMYGMLLWHLWVPYRQAQQSMEGVYKLQITAGTKEEEGLKWIHAGWKAVEI